MCADKVLKLTAGIDRALQHGAEYVMFADGDDLASNRIASLVSTQRGGPGWYNVGEYYHRYGSNWLWKRTIPPAHSSPTVIMRADLLEFASPYDRAGYWHQIVSTADNTSYIAALQKRSDRINTLAAVGHNNYPSLASHHGIPLLPLPFPASMVILHADSTSNVEGGEGSRLSADFARKPTWRKRLALSKRVLLHLAEFRPVNRRLRDEFAVPTYDQVPGEYRGTGVPLP